MKTRALVLAAILLVGCGSKSDHGDGNGTDGSGGSSVTHRGGSAGADGSDAEGGRSPSAGGAGGVPTAQTGGSSGGFEGECEAADDCPALETVPESCARSECQSGVCVYLAKDEDQDEFPAKRCTSREPGVAVVVGSDCDDGDPDVNPNAWDGPVGDGFEDGCNDDIDQDCNGLIDDGRLESGASCSCEPGQTGSCATTESGWPLQYPGLKDGRPLGACKLGQRECLPNGTWGQCTGAVGPSSETCDGNDEDCDGIASLQDVEDLVDAKIYVCDGDNDGYVPEKDAVVIVGCAEPSEDCGAKGSGQWVANPLPGVYTDCDDAAPTAYPGNIELCDGVDNDCDGEIDDNPPNAPTWSYDGDGDGYRDEDHPVVQQCARPSAPPAGCKGTCPADGWIDVILTSGDCNDDAAQINPSARDACDGTDWDCDGSPLTGCACNEGDDPQLCDVHEGYDGIGVCSAGSVTCIAGSWSRCLGAVGPEDELCGTKDLDCDGLIGDEDPDAIDRLTYTCDADGDGHLPATGAEQVLACAPPDAPCGDGSGTWLANAQPGVYDDCDDDDELRYPGKPELCDGVDNDCDGEVDDHALDAPVWSYDPDGDRFRSAAVATATQCDAPTDPPIGCDDNCTAGTDCVPCVAGAGAWVDAGAPISAGDCDESDVARNPSAADQCNGIDQNCDGSPLTGCACTQGDPDQECGTHDEDGFGICQSGVQTCVRGQWTGCVGSVSKQAERCGSTDYDCDGLDGNHDPDAIDRVTFACDQDADGYLAVGALEEEACGAAFITSTACTGVWIESPPASLYRDCDDANDTAYPGRPEVCDGGVNNDCDADENDSDAIDRLVWSYDQDGDGFRAYPTVKQCEAPTAAPSGCSGCPAKRWVGSTGALPDGDCDDTSDEVNPGVVDRCDGNDWNCDGDPLTDCDCVNGATRTCGTHPTDDVGVCRAGEQTCTAGSWNVPCVGSVGPSTEQCGALDYDCNGRPGNIDQGAAGQNTYTCDADSDGFIAVSGAATVTACGISYIDADDDATVPCAGTWTAGPTTGTDCNDANSQIYPGATERCGTEDYDCDHIAGNLDNDAIDRQTYVCDRDGDGRLAKTNPPAPVTTCSVPSSGCSGDWLVNPGSSFYNDCDDFDAQQSPVGVLEICDGKDNDCDDLTDAADDALYGSPSNPGVAYSCTGGEWVINECPPDTLHCDDNVYNGCETDATSLQTCRACDAVCSFSCGLAGCVEVMSLGLGRDHSCAVTATGQVTCWGSGTNGRIGDGQMSNRATPVTTSIISNASLVRGGGKHTCAVVGNEGSVYCWGAHGSGQLGSLASGDQSQPVLASISDVVELSAGWEHTCAVQSTGDLRCWGQQQHGRLGNANTGSAAVSNPVLASDTSWSGITNAASVACGAHHTCVLRDDDTIYCAGDDSYGQLGNSTTLGDPTQPGLFELTTMPSGASAVAAGDYHSCAIASGHVYCWGQNSFGQVGQPTSTAAFGTPTQVPGITTATRLVLGAAYSCALLTNATVTCWGDNFYGELGDPNDDHFSSPRTISGLSGVTEISGGGQHVCAQRGDLSQVYCWGYNGSAQLGVGSYDTNRNSTPLAVSPLTTN